MCSAFLGNKVNKNTFPDFFPDFKFNFPFILPHSTDGICRDIKKPPVGLYPFHEKLKGNNIYGDHETKASLVGVGYDKDMDGQSDSAVRFMGTSASYIEIPRNPTLDTTRDLSIVISIYPTGECFLPTIVLEWLDSKFKSQIQTISSEPGHSLNYNLLIENIFFLETSSNKDKQQPNQYQYANQIF